MNAHHRLRRAAAGRGTLRRTGRPPSTSRVPGPNTSVPIPCRACDLALIPFMAKKGTRSITCPRCRKATQVVVTTRHGKWFVRTVLTASAIG